MALHMQRMLATLPTWTADRVRPGFVHLRP